MVTDMKTRAVAGGQLSARMIETSLTHVAITVDGMDKAGCSRVAFANLLDDSHATDPHAAPTCPTCLRKWQKYHGAK